MNPIYDANQVTSLGEALFKSLSGAMPNGAKVGRQAMALNQGMAERIFGTSEDFMQRYRNFEEQYFKVLGDKQNLAKGARVMDMDLERASGKLDLSRLTYRSQRDLRDQFLKNVLNIEELLPVAGAPGMEFPTGNLYRNLLQYQVSDADKHPALQLMQRMFFNVDPKEQGLESLRFGTSNMLSSTTLNRITSHGDFVPEIRIKNNDV